MVRGVVRRWCGGGAKSSAEVVRRCGAEVVGAAVVRRWCGGSAEVVRRQCGEERGDGTGLFA